MMDFSNFQGVHRLETHDCEKRLVMEIQYNMGPLMQMHTAHVRSQTVLCNLICMPHIFPLQSTSVLDYPGVVLENIK